MSATIHVFDHCHVQIGARTVSLGSINTPQTITIDGEAEELHNSLPTATTWDVWEAGAERLGDFDFLWVESDQAVYLELTTDKGNQVGDEVFVIGMEANKPFKLFGDTGLANYTADFAAVTADVIDRIRIRNVSGTTANVYVFIAT